MRYNGSPAVAVVLLDCDTISQAKEKILDVVFKVSVKQGNVFREQ